MNTQFKNTD